MSVKKKNKKRLSRYILRKIGLGVDPDTLFSVQVKRIHEYKRQLLNILHVIALYHRIKADPAAPVVPRTVIFAGKAAPAYHQAKRIIKTTAQLSLHLVEDSGTSEETLVLVEKQFRGGSATVTRYLEAEAARTQCIAAYPEG